MTHIMAEWCCRFPEDAKAEGEPEKVQLRMTAGRTFSALPNLLSGAACLSPGAEQPGGGEEEEVAVGA